MMRYGAMNHPVKPVLEELEEIAELGFDYLELTLDPPEAQYFKILQQRKKLLAALDRHRMSRLSPANFCITGRSDTKYQRGFTK